MKIGYVQTSPIFGDKEKNFQQVRDLLNDIRADLIVLPELFATGYTFVSKKEAESMAEQAFGHTSEFLTELATKTNAIIVGGFVEKEKDHFYNSSLIVSSNEIVGTYRKVHLYFKEKLWFSPGNRPLKVYEINNIKIGVMICFDWFFPETIRTLALMGADIIAHPSNLVLPYCQNAMTTHCLVNHVFAITANRIGHEVRGTDSFVFTGGSQITSPKGNVISSAPIDKILVDFTDVDLNQARDKNINIYNNLLKDRRPDFYLIK